MTFVKNIIDFLKNNAISKKVLERIVVIDEICYPDELACLLCSFTLHSKKYIPELVSSYILHSQMISRRTNICWYTGVHFINS